VCTIIKAIHCYSSEDRCTKEGLQGLENKLTMGVLVSFNLCGFIHGLGTTFGTKDLRTMSHWISAFIIIYYYLIIKFELDK